jgi:hypothetical protein
VLIDKIVDEGTVVRRALEGPRNLVTVFHYVGKEVDVEKIGKASGGKKTLRTWRTCTEEEERRFKQLLAAREKRNPRMMKGTWIGQFGEVIVVSTHANKTAGLTQESKAMSDVWSRSVYASEEKLTAMPASKWICYDSEVMITNDMAVRTGVGKDVAVLVEIYEPKAPAAVVRIEPAGETVPVVTMKRSEALGEEEDLSDAEERVMLATGASRVSKKQGFGKLRGPKWSSGYDDEKWYIPLCCVKLARSLGTKAVGEICEDEQVVVRNGSVISVEETSWFLKKPVEVQGLENRYDQTVYLKSPEGFWYCWRWRESVEDLGADAWCSLPLGFSELILQILEPRPEPVRKAGHYSYKQEGKKENQATMFPELLKEIQEKQKALGEG